MIRTNSSIKIGLTILFSIWLVGCVNAPSTSNGKLNVVSTVAPIVNIIYNIAGNSVDLAGIIPEGTDSHTFEPAPADAIKIARADIIFVNGLDLETLTTKLAQANKKSSAEIFALGELTLKPEQYVFDFSFPKDKGHPNPHLWMNPLLALRYAEIVTDALARRDATHATVYQTNLDQFRARILALDNAIAQAMRTIPDSQRKLLTYHDSFAYFAQRYPIQVIGAIQPADFSEPSPRDLANLIAQIRATGVPAIFGSEVFPSKVLEQIGREANVRYVDALRDDELPGKPGDIQHSYFGMLVEDVKIIVEALGGNAAALNAFNVANIPGSDRDVNYGR
ncbi:MAG: zinc ABC transporter substrate-binding protein [Chloroflexi bacterium]|nr:zinc ABC transporter substrate-binding protein [Chloroflexota bacterium]